MPRIPNMIKVSQKLFCLGVLSTVGLGAMYGHMNALSEQGQKQFEKAQFYNVSNSLGFFYLSRRGRAKFITWPTRFAFFCFLFGQIAFVTPLYLKAIDQPIPIGKVMPAGGGSMIAAWLIAMFA